MTDIEEKVDAISVRNTPQQQSQKKKNNTTTLFVAIVVIIGCIAVFQDDIRNLLPEEVEEIIPEPIEPADVHLYKFSDLVSNDSVNVEIWIRNIGEETATDIKVYVRVRDHNGTILESGDLSMTTLLLRDNETCSGSYEIPIDDSIEYVTHTVELSWDGDRNSYSRETEI